jgi:ABC-type phosphate transport system substrate-binding protein
VCLAFAALVVCGAFLWVPSAGASGDEGFRIVVHRSSTVTTVSREFVADTFLRKATRWPDDVPSRPVDLPPSSTVRRSFSEQVLKRTVAAVRNYWVQRIFAGRDLPPPEVASDEAVIRYVAANRGAIGYVSLHANVEDAKVVPLR